MDIPHIVVVEELLPEVRRRVARSLNSSGWSQSRIGEKLGISQAMVSRYLREDGACPGSLEGMRDLIYREILGAILAGRDRSEVSERFCHLVRTCTAEGMMDERFRERYGHDPPVDCFDPLTNRSPRMLALEDLSDALSILEGKDITPLVPAIKVNIARAVHGARTNDEIASFPGRLMDRRGRITGASEPEFGASRHLAQTLLHAIKGNKEVSAAINLGYGPDVASILESRTGVVILERTRSGIGEILENPPEGGIRYLVDPGDFGVEPCLYILGRSAREVAVLALEIMEDMDKKGRKDENG
jgi:hypothetical protein